MFFFSIQNHNMTQCMMSQLHYATQLSTHNAVGKIKSSNTFRSLHTRRSSRFYRSVSRWLLIQFLFGLPTWHSCFLTLNRFWVDKSAVNSPKSPLPLTASCLLTTKTCCALLLYRYRSFSPPVYLLLLLLLLDISGVCRNQVSLQPCGPVRACWSQKSLDKDITHLRDIYSKGCV